MTSRWASLCIARQFRPASLQFRGRGLCSNRRWPWKDKWS